MAMTLEQIFKSKMKLCDLALVRILTYEQQNGTFELGTVYRKKCLFKNPGMMKKNAVFDFIGGTDAWGAIPCFAGEVCLFFVGEINHRIYQDHWCGHAPLKRIDGKLMCLLYQATPESMAEASEELRLSAVEIPRGLENDGISETWVPFEVLERCLKKIILEIDGEQFDSCVVKELEIA